MTPAEIDTAILKLAPDAIACIERTLRGTMKANQATTTCHLLWW